MNSILPVWAADKQQTRVAGRLFTVPASQDAGRFKAGPDLRVELGQEHSTCRPSPRRARRGIAMHTMVSLSHPYSLDVQGEHCRVCFVLPYWLFEYGMTQARLLPKSLGI
jgi:hypothetical protein